MTDPACPHCGNKDPSMLQPWREPLSQIPDEAEKQKAVGQKWYCECCGRTWIVQRLPFEGPDA